MSRYDDLESQQEEVTSARNALASALTQLAGEAALARRTTLRARSTDGLTEVHVAYRALVAAEERLDLALLDLATAGGEDG